MKANLLKAGWLLFFSLVLGGTAMVTTYESPINIESLQEQR